MLHPKVSAAIYLFALLLFSAFGGYQYGVYVEHRATWGSHVSLNSQFVQAAKAGNISELERLLALGADIDGTQGPGVGFTALDHAADRGNAKVVEWLLDHGADPKRGMAHGTAAVSAAEYRIAQSNQVVAALRARLPK